MEKRLRKALLFLVCLFSLQMWAQQREISGVVQDKDGMPLPGVSVFVKNTDIGTVTNFDGEFDLSLSDQTSPVLVFSSLGFIKQEITLGNENALMVTMQTDTESLDEVVVTALGI